MKLGLGTILVLTLVAGPAEANDEVPARQVADKGSAALEALIAAPQLVEYIEYDGADASVIAEYEENGRRIRPIKEAFAIAHLGPQAVKLVIDHLADTRLTRATFRSQNAAVAQRVPLGFVCLDILTNIVADDPLLFVAECGDDGLMACVNDGYSFRPDDFEILEGRVTARPIIFDVQSNWRKALDRGHVRYELSE